MDDEYWQKITRLQQEIKKLILKAEESGFDWRTFIQPLLEQRSALEHICRAKSAELGMVDGANERYINKNSDKAVGHLYRAYFDVADWFSITIREKLQELIEPYDNECITSVIPDYYQHLRPKIEDINMEFAELRDNKDISLIDDNIATQVDEYGAKLDFLLNTQKHLLSAIPALEEYRKKQREKTLGEKSWDIIKIVIAAIIGLITGYFLKKHGGN